MILGHVSFSVQPTRALPREDSLFLCFRPGQALLADSGGAPVLPTLGEARALLPAHARVFELAHTADRVIYTVDPLETLEVAEGGGLCYQKIRAFRSMPFSEGSLLASAYHLWNWYRRSRFCGACGAALTHSQTERALCCPACGELFFPMIAPAVIVAVTSGDSILLARNARGEFTHYALIAGYVEVGETLEHAVTREVKEEVGLDVCDLRYLGDQPWGVSGSLMFAFQARADKTAPLTLQQSEIADAKWVNRGELEPQPHPVSIAFELMERFRTNRL